MNKGSIDISIPDECDKPEEGIVAFDCRLMEDYKDIAEESDTKRKRRCYKQKIDSLRQEIKQVKT